MDQEKVTQGRKKTNRVAGDLTQVACSMTGFAFHLASMAGDLSVVLYGERDCANAFPRDNWGSGPSAECPFFTVAVSESEVIAGSTEDRLEKCLREVARLKRPIVVLTTCLTEMIGSDPGPVCETVDTDTGVRIVPVRTSGLQPRTQAEIMDWMAKVLITEFGHVGTSDADRVNFVGYQTGQIPDPDGRHFSFRDELIRTLPSMGLTFNAGVPERASFSDWTSLRRAGLTVVPERELYTGLLDLIEGPDHQVIELPTAKGIGGTDAFYAALATHAGHDRDTVLAGFMERRNAMDSLEEARKQFTGRRLVYGLGSHLNFEASQLIWEGLGDLPLLQEMGFSVELAIQERDRPEVHQRIRSNLEYLGVDLPYHLFYEPAVLAPILDEGGFDVAYLSDFLADQANRTGVPMVHLGRILPGYAGVIDACRLFAKAMTGGFAARYRRYM